MERRKITMKRRGFEEPLNQHSVNNTVINSQNMKLCLCSHTHDYDNDVAIAGENRRRIAGEGEEDKRMKE